MALTVDIAALDDWRRRQAEGLRSVPIVCLHCDATVDVAFVCSNCRGSLNTAKGLASRGLGGILIGCFLLLMTAAAVWMASTTVLPQLTDRALTVFAYFLLLAFIGSMMRGAMVFLRRASRGSPKERYFRMAAQYAKHDSRFRASAARLFVEALGQPYERDRSDPIYQAYSFWKGGSADGSLPSNLGNTLRNLLYLDLALEVVFSGSGDMWHGLTDEGKHSFKHALSEVAADSPPLIELSTIVASFSSLEGRQHPIALELGEASSFNAPQVAQILSGTDAADSPPVTPPTLVDRKPQKDPLAVKSLSQLSELTNGRTALLVTHSFLGWDRNKFEGSMMVNIMPALRERARSKDVVIGFVVRPNRPVMKWLKAQSGSCVGCFLVENQKVIRFKKGPGFADEARVIAASNELLESCADSSGFRAASKS